MTGKYYLPSKIIAYLKRLRVEYARSGNTLFSEIIGAGRVFVREETAYDNWDGGTYGHDVLFFLPASVLEKIALEKQKSYSQSIGNDLKACAQSVENEFFNAVSFEYEDENDPEYQQAISVAGRPEINPDTLSIWKPGYIRLFISHRDIHKAAAKMLADALEGYGISAFVAHDTIEPMTTWQNEILRGLETMEVMLTFLSDDFHESIWVNQEIGFALGRNIPIISLKLQKADPSGFIGSVQALRGDSEYPSDSAPDIYKILAQKPGNEKRLQAMLITAFVESPDFIEAKVRFERLNSVVDSLLSEEASSIVRGFYKNDQLHNAGYFTSNRQRLQRFLFRTTGEEYIIDWRSILPVKGKIDDEIPI